MSKQSQQRSQFRYKSGRLNWNIIKSINIDKIVQGNDTSLLQSVLDEITFSDISESDIQNVPSEYSCKLINLLQLTIEYLLICQEDQYSKLYTSSKKSKEMKNSIKQLQRENIGMKEDCKMYQKQIEMMRASLIKLQSGQFVDNSSNASLIHSLNPEIVQEMLEKHRFTYMQDVENIFSKCLVDISRHQQSDYQLFAADSKGMQSQLQSVVFSATQSMEKLVDKISQALPSSISIENSVKAQFKQLQEENQLKMMDQRYQTIVDREISLAAKEKQLHEEIEKMKKEKQDWENKMNSPPTGMELALVSKSSATKELSLSSSVSRMNALDNNSLLEEYQRRMDDELASRLQVMKENYEEESFHQKVRMGYRIIMGVIRRGNLKAKIRGFQKLRSIHESFRHSLLRHEITSRLEEEHREKEFRLLERVNQERDLMIIEKSKLKTEVRKLREDLCKEKENALLIYKLQNEEQDRREVSVMTSLDFGVLRSLSNTTPPPFANAIAIANANANANNSQSSSSSSSAVPTEIGNMAPETHKLLITSGIQTSEDLEESDVFSDQSSHSLVPSIDSLSWLNDPRLESEEEIVDFIEKNIKSRSQGSKAVMRSTIAEMLTAEIIERMNSNTK